MERHSNIVRKPGRLVPQDVLSKFTTGAPPAAAHCGHSSTAHTATATAAPHCTARHGPHAYKIEPAAQLENDQFRPNFPYMWMVIAQVRRQERSRGWFRARNVPPCQATLRYATSRLGNRKKKSCASKYVVSNFSCDINRNFKGWL